MSKIMQSLPMRHTRLKSVNESFGNLSQKPGIKKWRIQGDKFASQARGNLGTFYDEECYFILQTSRQGFKLERKGHIWIGASVNEERELEILHQVAEIEEHIQDIIKLTKQTQECETREFLDFFPAGIKYIMGPYGGYIQFENSKFVKKLYQVEGKRNTRIKQIPLNAYKINHGSSFILEDEWVLHIWNGRDSSHVERIKAIQVARTMRDVLCYGKAEINIIDEDKDREAELDFHQLLGRYGDNKPIIEENVTQEDKLIDQKPLAYRISEADGFVNFDEIQLQFHHKNQLQSKFSYLIYDGFQAYIWMGNTCHRNVNNHIVSIAQNFLRDKHFSRWLPIIRITESYEPREFRKLFDRWPYKTVDIHNGYVSIKNDEENFDHTDTSKSMLNDLLDDASGKIKIWQVEGFDIHELETDMYGIFYDNACYIVLYCNEKTMEYIIYIWQGVLSDLESRDYSMLYAQQIDNSLDWKATQLRIVFGQEPEHFLRIFKGEMMILMDEGYVNQSNYDVSLYQIVGTHRYNSKAIQLPPYSSFLDSEHTYLLQTEKQSYIWEGVYVTEESKDIAEHNADRIAPKGDIVVIQEGFEPREFWMKLGGREKYNIDRKKIKEYQRPRLYHCSDASGTFRVKEIRGYDQDDLNSDDVMILDTNEEIYIWIGAGANKNQKQKAWYTVKEYLERDPAGRAIEETSVMQVKQGQEPNCFACHFDDWDDQKTKKILYYPDVKKEVARENVELRRYRNRKQTTIRYLRSPREERTLRKIKNSSLDSQDEGWYQDNSSFYDKFDNHKRYAEPTISSSYKQVSTSIVFPEKYANEH